MTLFWGWSQVRVRVKATVIWHGFNGDFKFSIVDRCGSMVNLMVLTIIWIQFPV